MALSTCSAPATAPTAPTAEAAPAAQTSPTATREVRVPITTRSDAALAAMRAAEAHFDAERWRDAAQGFEAALALDGELAQAHAYLAATIWHSRRADADAHFVRARQLATALPESERLLIELIFELHAHGVAGAGATKARLELVAGGDPRVRKWTDGW